MNPPSIAYGIDTFQHSIGPSDLYHTWLSLPHLCIFGQTDFDDVVNATAAGLNMIRRATSAKVTEMSTQCSRLLHPI
jgi:hypothetical protein